VSKMMSKSELIGTLTKRAGDLNKKQIKGVLEGLTQVAYKELKKSGAFKAKPARKVIKARFVKAAKDALR
jgi:DNA-binding protein HU-beta